MCNKVKTVQGSWICPVIFIPWSHAGLTCNLMSVRLSDYHSSNNQKKHVAGILQCPYQFRHSLYDSIPTCTRGISISIVRLLPIRFLLYLPIWVAASQSESCIIKGYLRTWCHRYFIWAKLKPDRNMRATVRLNSKRSWSPTHLRLSSWPPTTRRLLQFHTCTWQESLRGVCQWHCSLLRLGLKVARTMQRSHVDTLLYAHFLVV